MTEEQQRAWQAVMAQASPQIRAVGGAVEVTDEVMVSGELLRAVDEELRVSAGVMELARTRKRDLELEQARIETLEASLRELAGWMREHTSAIHDAGTYDMLVRAHEALQGEWGDER